MKKLLNNHKLLLVGSYPPPFGGVSSFITELEKGLAADVAQFYVLCFESKESVTQKVSNITIHRIRNRPNRILITTLLKQPFAIVSLLFKYIRVVWKDAHLYTASLMNALIVCEVAKKNESTSVTIFTTRAGACIPFLKLLLPKIPIYYCVFADPYINPDYYKKHKEWYREALVKAEKVFSSSYYCAAVTKLFDEAILPAVIYVGVDTERFHPSTPQDLSRRQLGLPEDCDLILSVARMEPEMGIRDILSIAERVLAVNDTVTFVLAGAKGSVTQKVEEAAAISRGRIVCRVDVRADDLPKYYAASTIVMAPTVGVHACMGVSVKEAMAAGRPVVVSDSGGLPEAVQNSCTGLIVPLSKSGSVDVGMFSDALISLLMEPVTRQSMGGASRQRALDLFTAEATVKNYKQMILTNN